MGDIGHEVIALGHMTMALALWVGLCVLALVTLSVIAGVAIAVMAWWHQRHPPLCRWCMVPIDNDEQELLAPWQLPNGDTVYVEIASFLCDACASVDATRRLNARLAAADDG